MGDIGIDFAGDGGAELGINKNSTDAPNHAGGGENVIDFIGNVGQDGSHNNVNTNSGRSQSIPGGGQIEFAGDV